MCLKGKPVFQAKTANKEYLHYNHLYTIHILYYRYKVIKKCIVYKKTV